MNTWLMEEITAETLRDAAELIGIPDKASLCEIQHRYYERIKEWHPDVSEHGPEEAHEMTIRLKAAYDCLCTYCMNYPFSFPERRSFREPGADTRTVLEETFR